MSYEKSTDLIQVGLPVKQSFEQVFPRVVFLVLYVCIYGKSE